MIPPDFSTRLSSIQVCPDPIFIIGSPRSGTTILARSLAQHSQLWTSTESDILFSLYGTGQAARAYQHTMARPWKSWLQAQQVGREEFLEYLGYGVNALFTGKSQGKRWIDHTNVYTLMADLLAEMFPGACFLHVLRDGRRVVHSMINFSQAPNVVNVELTPEYTGPWMWDFREACKMWRRYVDASYKFCEAHPTRSLTIVNETLAANPRVGMGEILEFLGLPFEEAPGEFFRTNRINSSFQPDSASAGSPLLLQPWETWSADQKRIFAEQAGSTLVACGFATRDEMALGGDALQIQIELSDEQAAPNEDVRRERAVVELEQWAHGLEETVLQQQQVIRTYEHWFAPVLALVQLGRKLKSLRRNRAEQ
jgi:hypothetical protein